MYALGLPTRGLKNSVWDFSSRVAGGDGSVDAFGEDDGFGERCFAFPAQFAVRWRADLISGVSRITNKMWDRKCDHTSYQRGPSFQIWMSLSLKAFVCGSMSSRLNLEESTVMSDVNGMMAIVSMVSTYNARLLDRLGREQELKKEVVDR